MLPPLSPPPVLYHLNLYWSSRITASPACVALPFICFHICGFICDYSGGFFNRFSCSKDIKRMTGCNESPLHLMRSLKSVVLCRALLPLGTISSFQEGHVQGLASACDPVAVAAPGVRPAQDHAIPLSKGAVAFKSSPAE